MPASRWKRLRPTSLRHALELCMKHARDKHNRSPDRIATLIGLPARWTLYKWIQSGRIPGTMIRPFEHACGIDYVTQFLAFSNHQLLIDIPTGKHADPGDVNDLQVTLTEATRVLIDFYRGDANAEETITALTDAMTSLAWHRENVSKTSDPELDLFEGGE